MHRDYNTTGESYQTGRQPHHLNRRLNNSYISNLNSDHTTYFLHPKLKQEEIDELERKNRSRNPNEKEEGKKHFGDASDTFMSKRSI